MRLTEFISGQTYTVRVRGAHGRYESQTRWSVSPAVWVYAGFALGWIAEWTTFR